MRLDFQRVACVAPVLLLASAATAAAQPWSDAYKRADYTAAAALLQPLVFEHAPAEGEGRYPDARAVHTLGQMYAAGLGVPRDPVLGCALFGLATGAAVYQHGSGHAVTSVARRLLDEHCVRLSIEDRREAARIAACPSIASGAQAFVIGQAHRVEVSRGAVRIRHKGQRREHWLGDLVDCAPFVPAVRHTVVTPPSGSAKPVRHFLEILAWRPRAAGADRMIRVLEWRAVEIRGGDLVVAARTNLQTVESDATAGLPATNALKKRVSLRMLGDGRVRWQIAGEPRASGLVASPAASRRPVGLER